MRQQIKRHDLSRSEGEYIRALTEQLAKDRTELNELDFLADDAVLLSHKLPDSLQRLMHDFKSREDACALRITGLPITEEVVGPTPLAHRSRGDHRIGRGEAMHGMMAPLLGDPFGWDTQQNGRVFTDVIAFEDSRHVVNASVSAEHDFSEHTEDAFHECLPDYLFLVGFRNIEQAPTTISSLANVEIPDAVWDVLAEPGRCWNRPNLAHTGAALGTAQRILWGDRKSPYLRINVPNIAFAQGDAEAEAALEWVKRALAKNREGVVIEQGHLLVINNMACVHARDRFNPIYGPQARWLSRLAITHDLRKSRSLRTTPEARVILSAA